VSISTHLFASYLREVSAGSVLAISPFGLRAWFASVGPGLDGQPSEARPAASAVSGLLDRTSRRTKGSYQRIRPGQYHEAASLRWLTALPPSPATPLSSGRVLRLRESG
jgi:hypothetical protein